MSEIKLNGIEGRDVLGNYFHVVCGRAILDGIQETLGEAGARALLVQAGRKRGQSLAVDLGDQAKPESLEQFQKVLGEQLGSSGTRLCLIKEVTGEWNHLQIYVSDLLEYKIESAYTLGVFQGFLEQSLDGLFQGTIEKGEKDGSVVLCFRRIE
ncbi:MAG: hypothetical protein AAF558_02190 [Verrucomicrobiota bacterium]